MESKQKKECASNGVTVPSVVNPYYYKTPIPWYRAIQIFFMSITLAPLRLVVMITAFLLMGVICSVIAIGLPMHRTTPLTGWRKHANGPLKFLLYTLFVVGGFHRIRTKGKIAPAAQSALIVGAPHTSFLDVVCGMVGGVHAAVSIIEHADAPVVGSYFRFAQMIFVDRHDPESREDAMRQLKMRAQSGGKWVRTVVFPEGACTNGVALIPFKLGSFSPGEPVQPLLIHYHNSWNTYAWPPEGTWVFWQLWFSLCQFHNSCTLEYLPVYKPNAAEKEDPALYANNVRAMMSKELGIPTTDLTYKEYKRLKQEKRQLSSAENQAEPKREVENGSVTQRRNRAM